MKPSKLPQVAFNKLAETLTGHAIQLGKDLGNMIIRSIKNKVMFTMTIKDSSEVYYAFQDWFYENHEDKFQSVTVYNVPKNSDGQKVKNSALNRYDTSGYSFDIGYSQDISTHMINYEGTFIQVTKNVINGNRQTGEKEVQQYTLVSTSKDKVKKMIEEIYSKYNQDHDQIKIFVSDFFGEWRMAKRLTGKSLDNIIMEDTLHAKLVGDLEEFDTDKEWYEQMNIPYKRGYLLHGPPGNGKTSLSIAMASQFKRNIYCLDVNKLKDDGALRYAFSSLQANALLLIEDVDVAFHMSREMDTKRKPQVTFACLLNCLDGVYYKEGLITVMTTNHVEKLDPALIRPGRMDLKVNIPNPAKAEVERYMTKFYRTEVVLDEYTKNIPMAAVQGVCISNKTDLEAAKDALINFDDQEILRNYTVNQPEVDAESDTDKANKPILELVNSGDLDLNDTQAVADLIANTISNIKAAQDESY